MVSFVFGVSLDLFIPLPGFRQKAFIVSLSPKSNCMYTTNSVG